MLLFRCCRLEVDPFVGFAPLADCYQNAELSVLHPLQSPCRRLSAHPAPLGPSRSCSPPSRATQFLRPSVRPFVRKVSRHLFLFQPCSACVCMPLCFSVCATARLYDCVCRRSACVLHCVVFASCCLAWPHLPLFMAQAGGPYFPNHLPFALGHLGCSILFAFRFSSTAVSPANGALREVGTLILTNF